MEVPLINSSKKILVDSEDYLRVMEFNWRINYTNGPAIIRSNRPCIPITHFIMRERGCMFDHKDLNIFNNQKENLRKCTRAQNKMNSEKYDIFRGASSQYKGVSYNKRQRKWVARIRANNTLFFLGYFDTEIEAAIAYNNAAIKRHGEFAKLNEIPKL